MTSRFLSNTCSAIFLAVFLIAATPSAYPSQSRRVPPTPPSQQPANGPPPDAPATPEHSVLKWEYRILKSPLSQVNNQTTDRVTISRWPYQFPLPLPGKSLEDQIKELAEQGFEVQDFIVIGPGDRGSLGAVEYTSEVVVLLRRAKN
jgi:hypothetical protein